MNDELPDGRQDAIKNPDRLTEIAELGLLEQEGDAELQKLAAQAAQDLGLPTGVVSIALDEAQWVVAAHGVKPWVTEAGGTPLEWSFCRNVVDQGSELVVEDATRLETMQDSPLVRVDGLRCYAGIPLVSANGHVIGSFCVQGETPKEFTDGELTVLRKYAGKAMERIETRRPALR